MAEGEGFAPTVKEKNPLTFGYFILRFSTCRPSAALATRCITFNYSTWSLAYLLVVDDDLCPL
jgi:hypothetical protein